MGDEGTARKGGRRGGGVPAPRNTTGLHTHTDRARADAARRATEAIDRMWKAGLPVTVAAVAREAGLSRSYLYKAKDVLARIRAMEGRQTDLRLTPGGVPDARRTDKTKDAIIAAQGRKIRQLEAEVVRLKAENERLLAAGYEKL